jgi:predicted nucleic acid-binding protein
VKYYIDTSAAVKLVNPEPETEALHVFLRQIQQEPGSWSLVSSDLLKTEILSAVLRAGMAPSVGMRAINSVYLLRLTPQICESAGMLSGQLGVRSLDALHLATAVSERSTLRAFVTYDQKLGDAARELGIQVEAPTS